MSMSFGNLFNVNQKEDTEVSKHKKKNPIKKRQAKKEKEDSDSESEDESKTREKSKNYLSGIQKYINHYIDLAKDGLTDNQASNQKVNEKEEEEEKKEGIPDYLIDDPHTNFQVNDGLENIHPEMEEVPEMAEGFTSLSRRGGGKDVGGGIPFWVDNPNVLLCPKFIYEWFPIEGMTYNQKLNAISRLVLLLTIVGFVILRTTRILIIGTVCLLGIFLIYYSQTRTIALGNGKEGFIGADAKPEKGYENPAANAVINFATDDPKNFGKKKYFDVPKIDNPYNNVLVTDIVDNPNKLPAPPSYYPETEKAILDKTKEAIQKMNPTFPGMIDKLFNSFDDHFEFEQSQRQFFSNPATTLPNDQGGFAEFCYGEMISCKEGNRYACARDSARYNLY